MIDSPQLDEALALALKLSPRERLRLIARVASSIEPEMVPTPDDPETAATGKPEGHWGRELLALLDTMDLSAWQSPEFDDPVEWLQKMREAQSRERLGDWGAPEWPRSHSNI